MDGRRNGHGREPARLPRLDEAEVWLELTDRCFSSFPEARRRLGGVLALLAEQKKRSPYRANADVMMRTKLPAADGRVRAPGGSPFVCVSGWLPHANAALRSSCLADNAEEAAPRSGANPSTSPCRQLRATRSSPYRTP
jgi:hypothetical protein